MQDSGKENVSSVTAKIASVLFKRLDQCNRDFWRFVRLPVAVHRETSFNRKTVNVSYLGRNCIGMKMSRCFER